jgi:transcriptional regulator with XRE-family HTH domain
MTMMMQRPESTVRIEVVGAELRRLRDLSGLTLHDVATMVGVSIEHLSKMETGKRSQSVEDVASLLTVYKVFGQDRRDLLELARHSARLGLWQTRSGSFDSRVSTLRLLESRATAIVAFETVLVPGLLQTVRYAQAMFRDAGMLDDQEEIDNRVVSRIQRQRVARSRGTDLTAIVCESALHNLVGGEQVMREQLSYLVEAAGRPNVTFRVVPASAGAHPGLGGPFHRMRFADRPGVVFAGCGGTSLYLEDPVDVEHHKNITAELLKIALSQEDSIALTETIATNLH